MGNLCEAPHLQISCASLTYCEYDLNSFKLSVVQGNLIEEDVDAIITTSSPNLRTSNCFGRYILTKAGKEVENECDKLIEASGIFNYGAACFTSAGNLPCDYIIHAIVPPYDKEKEDLFFLCMRNCLLVAEELKIKSLSCPLLCSGIPGYPKEVCVMNMLKILLEFSDKAYTSLNEIRIVNHDNPSVRLFDEELKSLIPEKKVQKKKYYGYGSGFLKNSGYDKNKIEVKSSRLILVEEEKNAVN